MADAKLAGQIHRMWQRRSGPLILELDLTDGIAEGPPQDPVQALLTIRRTRLPDLLEGLKRASADDRVRALVVKVGGARLGLAKTQELRAAVTDFRRSGKLTVAWAETFGDFVRGNLPYYLATGFDRIYLQPSGTLGLTGVAVEQVFLRGALDKLGIGFESATRYEYKSAADQLTETGFTGPAREAVQRLAESVAEQLTAAIAEGRHKSPEQARELLQRGPFLAQQALDEGLVDGLHYRDEVYDQLHKEAGLDAMLLYLQRYQRTHALAELPRRVQSMQTAKNERFVAMIYAHGAIRHGRSGRGPGPGGGMGSDTVSAALRAAAADERARAVVLRVNSPGGSATASDVIWREVVRLRAAGKPVVVSMGDVAASGGYFISAPADVIVAQPGTITGSIGVILGKPVLREIFGRAGVSTDTVTVGDNATMFSLSRPFTDAEWDRINGWLDAVYEDFTEKVASGRRLSRDRVHELARGRVWSGADAVANGLADETGGMRDAIAIARRRRVERGPPRRCRYVRHPRAVHRRLGPGVAVRGGGRPAALRAADSARCMEDQFTGALSAWAAGVTLVTIADGRDDVGTTVSAFMPVSLDPPLLLVSLALDSYPAEVLSRPSLPAVRFAVTLLSAAQKMLAGRFAAEGRPSARLALDDVPHVRGSLSGALIPSEGLAALECSVARRVPAGDHLLVIASVIGVPYTAETGDPLIRFRGRYPVL
jgi:protease-4